MELVAYDLVKRYGDKVAVDGVSLTARPGVVALLGPNGSGKTTLLRMLATVSRPDRGEIRFGGRCYAADPRPVRRVLGYLPQQLDLPDHMTPLGLLRYMASLKGVDADPSLLDTLGLPADKPIAGLSGGQVRRVGIAQALLGTPRLRDRVLQLVNQPGSGRVVVLSSHMPGEVEAIARQVIVLKTGRAVYAGDVAGLCDRAKGRVDEVVVPAAQVQSCLESWLVSRVTHRGDEATLRTLGAAPPDAIPVPPTLEDAYLMLQQSATA